MLRTVSSVALLVCGLATPAWADDPPASPPKAKAAPKAAPAKKPGRPKARKADAAASTSPLGSLLAPAPTPGRSGDAASRPPVAGQDAWSFNPKWSASNGGSSAPYGTRALMNELGANPAETTGYGAGAEVNFHF